MTLRKFLDFVEFKLFKFKWAISLLLLFFCIVFRHQIEDLINSHIVIRYLNKIQDTIVNDCIFLISLVSIFLIFLNRLIRNYRISIFRFFLVLLIAIVYLYYRNFYHLWEFTKLHLLSIYYFDIIFFVCAFYIILEIFNSFSKKRNIDNNVAPFVLDEPLDSDGEDLLNRTADANELANRLSATISKKAFAIGINGEWGFGKSSFFELIKNEISKDSSNIIIDFNPWRGYKNNGLYKDFFEVLSQSIGKYNDLLRISLKNYGDTLLNVNEGILQQAINISNDLFSVNSIEGQHNEINAALEKVNKKFYVFIDDLDRLTTDEIIEVLKLVRNTADFYNLKFILAYDKNYLVNALKSINNYNYTNYLEKIILYEYNLAPIESTQLTKEFNKLLKLYCVKDLQGELEEMSKKKTFERNHLIGIYLYSLRDVKRFANSFIPRINKYYKEIDMIDYINLEILRLKYPLMLYKLYYDKHKFLQNGDNGILQFIKSSNLKENTLIEDYILEHHDYLQIEKANASKLISLIKSIFIADRIFESLISEKSIKRDKNFGFYFRNEIAEYAISYSEFEDVITADMEIIELKFNEWVEIGKRTAVIDKFRNFKFYDYFTLSDEFEKFIKSIFLLANIEKVEKDVYAGYPDKDLFDIIYEKEKISKVYYNNSTEKYKEFIDSIFANAKFPYFMESDILDYISVNLLSDKFILSQDEIEKYMINYFKNYTIHSNILDDGFWRLYHNCRKGVLQGNTITKEHLPKAKEYYKKFVFKNTDILKGYLNAVTDGNIREEELFMINRAVVDVFESYEKFVELLMESKFKDEDFVIEFLNFHEVFAKSDYKVYVPFNFKYL